MEKFMTSKLEMCLVTQCVSGCRERRYVGLKSPKSLRRNLDSIFTWKVHTRAASYGHVSRVSKLAALLDRSMVVAISNSILEDAQTG